MPPGPPNPHDAVCPDFAIEEFLEARRELTDAGLTEAQAIATLVRLWTLENNRSIARWDRQAAEDTQAAEDARLLAATAEELLLQ